MLGLGWTEMLVIGIAALIFIGPKDLPVVMGRIGKVMGQIRRMGNEFQREINRTTGLDEVRNLRNSITSPLKKTAEEIRREFNTMTPTGQQKPSGALKPADPKAESVVDEIRSQAGMTPARKSNDEIAAEAGFKPTAKPAAEPVKAARAAKAPVKAARPRAPARARPAPTGPVAASELPPVAEAKPEPAPARPARTRSAKPAAAKPAPRKAAAAEPAAEKPARPRARRKPADTAGKGS